MYMFLHLNHSRRYYGYIKHMAELQLSDLHIREEESL